VVRREDYFDGEDDAQVDGEANYAVNFVPNQAQPWLRTPNPPWHMWGTTENVPTSSGGGGFTPPINGSAQLVKINYKRPETWHFLFYARLVQGEATDIVQFGQSIVEFDVTVGHGRASVTMQNFERLTIEWQPSRAAPIGVALYSTEVYGPNRTMDITPAAQRENRISEIVAQDIQVSARVRNGSNFPTNLITEVGAFFAPKTHVRPDWMSIRAPLETQFAGDEVQGR